MIVSGRDAQAIEQAVQALRAGQLVGLPTETVYGLAADAHNDAALAQVFARKGRPADHPLIVHLASGVQVGQYAAEVPAFAQRLIDAFWPGPLTLILPRHPQVGRVAAGGQDAIGLRCPSHPVAQAVLRAFGRGLAAPSANRFGRVSPTTAAHVQDEFGPDLLVIDGGPCAVGIESTIVDCTRGAPVLLRPGRITADQIETVCAQTLAASAQLGQAAPRASGTLESHYAPRAKVRLLSADALKARLRQRAAADVADVADVAQSIGVWSTHEPEEVSEEVSEEVPKSQGDGARPGAPKNAGAGAAGPQGVRAGRPARPIWRQRALEPERAAQQLFAVLRELDALGVAEIWVEDVPASTAWAGIGDRLRRAAA